MQFFPVLKVSITLLTFFTTVVFAYIGYKNNPKSATNKVFGFLCLCTTIWLVDIYLSTLEAFLSWSLLLDRISIFLAIPQVVSFFLLADTLPHEKLKISKKLLLIIVLLSVITMLITISPYAFTRIEIVNNAPPRPIPGWGMGIFVLFSISFSLLAIYTLIHRLIKAVGVEKQQLRFIMLGILLMLGLIIATILLPVVFFGNTFFVPFVPLYVLVFLGMTAYAIVRHRLMDIRLVVARSAAYALILLILTGFYTVYLLFVGSSILSIHFSQTQFIFYGLIMLIAAFTFQPLRRNLELITDKVFYKGHYDSQELLSNLSHIMSSTIDLEKLTAEVLDKVLHDMRIIKGAFVLLKKKDHGLIDYVESKGFNKAVTDYKPEDIQGLLINRKIEIFDDLEEGELKKTMRELNAFIVLPLMVHEEKIGVVIFGEKASGDIYSKQDINVLEILAPELSVAIQNAKEYEEIKAFNVTLREEIEKATKDLKVANEQLKELDIMKDEFVSIASHELRTPMTAIKSYLWMALAGKGGELTEKQRYYVQRGYNSVDRLIRLVNDMLNVSRIDSGRITLDLQAVSLDKLAQEVVEEVLPRAQELGVHVELMPVTSLPPVLADPDKIKEVLFNLIGNSLKFTPQDGKITVSFSQKGEMIETTVSDTGTGMGAEDIPKLFQKFGMIQDSYIANRPIQGTGLGLYICRSILELHQGKIWALSEGKDKGSQFIFTLKVFNEEEFNKQAAANKDAENSHTNLIHSQI